MAAGLRTARNIGAGAPDPPGRAGLKSVQQQTVEEDLHIGFIFKLEGQVVD
jgi:hypothetical protein